jgi:hypothetical protein
MIVPASRLYKDVSPQLCSISTSDPPELSASDETNLNV